MSLEVCWWPQNHYERTTVDDPRLRAGPRVAQDASLKSKQMTRLLTRYAWTNAWSTRRYDPANPALAVFPLTVCVATWRGFLSAALRRFCATTTQTVHLCFLDAESFTTLPPRMLARHLWFVSLESTERVLGAPDEAVTLRFWTIYVDAVMREMQHLPELFVVWNGLRMTRGYVTPALYRTPTVQALEATARAVASEVTPAAFVAYYFDAAYLHLTDPEHQMLCLYQHLVLLERLKLYPQIELCVARHAILSIEMCFVLVRAALQTAKTRIARELLARIRSKDKREFPRAQRQHVLVEYWVLLGECARIEEAHEECSTRRSTSRYCELRARKLLRRMNPNLWLSHMVARVVV